MFGGQPATGSNRIQRGGSWNNDADNARVANRNNNNPNNRNNNYGFRLANAVNSLREGFFQGKSRARLSAQRAVRHPDFDRGRICTKGSGW